MSEISKKINPQLRFKGKILRVLPASSKGYFKIARGATSLLFKRKKIKGVDFKEVYIGEDNSLRLCIYSKSNCNSKNMPIILWIHGGGYGMGMPEVDYPFMNEFFSVSDCVIVSPDYTLSYKKPYPNALMDCYKALLWAYDNATLLNCNKNCIFVGGDSAGGGLTMALCLYARDQGMVKISYQMPIYPMIDDRETNTNKNNVAPVWNTKSNVKAWKIYLGKQFRSEDLSYYAAPARCEDYSGLPSAISYVGELDPFLDETVTAFEKLKRAGINAELLIMPGCYHGFDIVCPKSEVAKEARAFLIAGYKKAIEKYNK